MSVSPQLFGLGCHHLLLRVAGHHPPLEEQVCLGEVRSMGTFVEHRVLDASVWVCQLSLHVDMCLRETAVVTYRGGYGNQRQSQCGV